MPSLLVAALSMVLGANLYKTLFEALDLINKPLSANRERYVEIVLRLIGSLSSLS